MPVFGADISAKDNGWDTPSRERTYHVPSDTYEDAKYFVYHPMAPIDHPFDKRSWSAVLQTVTKLRMRGYDSRAIRGAMNAFYLQRNADGKHPAFVFANNAILARLMYVYEPVYVDSVMHFIANGFIRTNYDLPWGRDDDSDVRRAIMNYAEDLPYRYPKVVADLLMEYAEYPVELNSQLRYVNDIVKWNLDRDVTLDIKTHIKAVKVRLPAELSTSKRSPTLIAEAAPTLKDAILWARKRGNRELRNANRLEK